MLLASKRGRGAHEGAHRLGHPALAADHLTQIVVADTQSQDGRVAVVADLAYLDGVRIVYEVAREEFNQLMHWRLPMPCFVCSAEAGTTGWAGCWSRTARLAWFWPGRRPVRTAT